MGVSSHCHYEVVSGPGASSSQLELLRGDDGGSGTGTESPLSPGILGQLESALTPPTEAPKPDVLGTVMAIMDVVSGKSSELPLEGIAALFGITATPIPSPVKEPLKFLMR